MHDPIILSRDELDRAAARLLPLDFWALLRLAVRANATAGELAASPKELAEILKLPECIVRDILGRLEARGYLAGVLHPQGGGHLVVRLLVLSPPPGVPLAPPHQGSSA